MFFRGVLRVSEFVLMYYTENESTRESKIFTIWKKNWKRTRNPTEKVGNTICTWSGMYLDVISNVVGLYPLLNGLLDMPALMQQLTSIVANDDEFVNKCDITFSTALQLRCRYILQFTMMLQLLMLKGSCGTLVL